MGSAVLWVSKTHNQHWTALDQREGICEELKKIGYLGRLEFNILAYLEAHIEQGPVLENEKIQIGVVSGA